MFYIDVSHYDWDRYGGNLNWNQIKANGIDVVIIRASYGDPKIYNPQTRYFKEMALEAKKAGLRVGGYHNLIHGNFASIQRQVTYFKEQLDSVNADYAMIDVEPYESLKANDLWPRLADAELFAQEFRNQDSRKLMIYLPQWVWANWLDKADLRPLMDYARGILVSSNYPLGTEKDSYTQLYMHANGDNGPGWTAYGNVVPEAWQFSSNSMVPGASSITDVNAFIGTSEEFDTRMAWVLTKNMQAFRDQMNEFFPNRVKTSDGTIGDYAHTQEKSGHNPDDTSQHNAEWDSDSDTKSEVRAIDIDSNTGDPNVSMEDIFQHLIALGKSQGSKFPVRYMIYNRRIARASNNWNLEAYKGASAHTEHIHLSGAYSDAADENYYNYRLDELVALTDAEKNEIITKTAAAVWNYMLERPDSTTNPKQQSAAGTYQRWNDVVNNGAADKVINALAPAITAIAQKVDLDPTELAAIKDSLNVPTAQENAAAVVAALGQVDTNTLVNTLKDGLSDDQIAALKQAL